MKQLFKLIACLAIGLLSMGADAADRATPAGAQALVKRAIVHYQKHGKQNALDEFSKSPGPFVDRDLYVTVLTMEGDSLAHINPKMRGHNMMDFRDVDGKYAIKERTELARKEGSGWHDERRNRARENNRCFKAGSPNSGGSRLEQEVLRGGHKNYRQRTSRSFRFTIFTCVATSASPSIRHPSASWRLSSSGQSAS